MAPFLNSETSADQTAEVEQLIVKPVLASTAPNGRSDQHELKSAGEVDVDVEKLSQRRPAPVNYPKSKLELINRPVDEPRKLRVAVIGAGLAGITAGIFLPAKVPGIELTIFDKNEDVGGTWLENKYPGVRCDIPSHVYQPTFLHNPEWTEKFARGPEILAYWKTVAKTNDVYRFIRFNSLIQKAEWDPAQSVWQLSVLDLQKNEAVIKEPFDFVLNAIGRFNAWRLPEYPGMDEYGGYLAHSSNWDPSLETSGKCIAVIGNGASGIQLVPELQKVVARLDHYARSPTWIAGAFAGQDRGTEPELFTAEQLELFKDPETYLAYRKEAEGKYWRGIKAMNRESTENAEMRSDYIKIMRKRLAQKPELLEKLVPSFSPHCRRLTPGPGYLEAICQDNVDYIQTLIRRFTKTGIETDDGVHREVDAVICATGFNIDFAPPFPIIAHGKNLSEAWKPGGSDGFPKTYLGLAAANFPNFLFVGGPHVTGASGTLNHCVETQLVYHARLLRKVATQHIKTISPKEQAVEDFVDYADAYFPTTPLVDNCSSWANGGKPGNRIHGAWPGSASHVTFIRRDPRWEDWEYEYESPSGNRFAYFGNGRTLREADPESDMTAYLKKPSEVDVREVHESWFQWP